MNKITVTFIAYWIALLFFLSPLVGQHSLSIYASKDMPMEVDFKAPSCMARGSYFPKAIRLESIGIDEDGKINFQITSLEGSGEDLVVSLTGTDSFFSKFTYKLEDGELYIEELLEGVSIRVPVTINKDIYNYNNNDELCIYRCKDKIIYLINNEIARVTPLPHNDFELRGFFTMVNNSNVDIEANISFNL